MLHYRYFKPSNVQNTRDKYVNLKNPPTSIVMQVSKFIRDDFLVEIEATAVIPKK